MIFSYLHIIVFLCTFMSLKYMRCMPQNVKTLEKKLYNGVQTNRNPAQDGGNSAEKNGTVADGSEVHAKNSPTDANRNIVNGKLRLYGGGKKTSKSPSEEGADYYKGRHERILCPHCTHSSNNYSDMDIHIYKEHLTDKVVTPSSTTNPAAEQNLNAQYFDPWRTQQGLDESDDRHLYTSILRSASEEDTSASYNETVLGYENVYPKSTGPLSSENTTRHRHSSVKGKQRKKYSSSSSRYYPCPQCRKTFRNENALQGHIHLIHSNNVNKYSPEKEERQRKSSSSWNYHCPKCPVIFHDENALQVHVNSAHLKNKYRPRSTEKEKHRKSSSSRGHHCPNCAENFQNEDALQAHVNTKHLKKSRSGSFFQPPENICPICKSYTSDSVDDLAAHAEECTNYRSTTPPKSVQPREDTTTPRADTATARTDNAITPTDGGRSYVDTRSDQLIARNMAQEEEEMYRRIQEEQLSYQAIYAPGGILEQEAEEEDSNDTIIGALANRFKILVGSYSTDRIKNLVGSYSFRRQRERMLRLQAQQEEEEEELRRAELQQKGTDVTNLYCSDEIPDDYFDLSHVEDAIDGAESRYRDVIEDVEDRIENGEDAENIDEYFLSSEVDFYSYMPSDGGWGCGYRNFQMLLSALLKTKKYSDIVRYHFRKLGVQVRDIAPSISTLQKTIEYAWKIGFDEDGQKALRGNVYNTTKWIGAGEIKAVLSSMRIRVEMIDVYKGDKDGYHSAMFQWIINYFESNIQDKMPIYLQHDGHSRTAIGVEIWKQGDIYVLILDPNIWAFRLFQNNENDTALRQMRVDIEGFVQSQYQLLRVTGIMESDDEYESSKMVISEIGI